MRKTMTAAAIALVLGALVAGPAAAKDKLRIATEGAFAPWNATDASGKLIGFEIDLAQELCKRIDADCQVVAQDWDGIIPALQQGKYDAIMAAMSITDEREKAVAFSHPYATEPSIFATSKGSPFVALSFPVQRVDLANDTPEKKAAIDTLAAALKGKTVGVQVSTTQLRMMETLFPGVAVRSYDKLDSAGLDLVAGRVDAILGSRSSVEAVIKSEGSGNAVVFGPGFLRGILGRGVGVALRKDATDLKARFDKAVDDATKDGTITTLSTRWFGFDASIPRT